MSKSVDIMEFEKNLYEDFMNYLGEEINRNKLIEELSKFSIGIDMINNYTDKESLCLIIGNNKLINLMWEEINLINLEILAEEKMPRDDEILWYCKQVATGKSLEKTKENYNIRDTYEGYVNYCNNELKVPKDMEAKVKGIYQYITRLAIRINPNVDFEEKHKVKHYYIDL